MITSIWHRLTSQQSNNSVHFQDVHKGVQGHIEGQAATMFHDDPYQSKQNVIYHHVNMNEKWTNVIISCFPGI